MSFATDTHSLPVISCDIVLSLSCIAWKSRYVGQFLFISSMLALMLTNKMDSHDSRYVFLYPCGLSVAGSVPYFVVM